MEAGKNQNSFVNNDSDDQTQIDRKMPTDLSEKLSQIMYDDQQIQSNVIALKKAVVKGDSTRSSANREVSLVDCRCRCHADDYDVNRYILIEDSDLDLAEKSEASMQESEVISKSSEIIEPSLKESEIFSKDSECGKKSLLTESALSVKASTVVASEKSLIDLSKIDESLLCGKCGKVKSEMLKEEESAIDQEPSEMFSAKSSIIVNQEIISQNSECAVSTTSNDRKSTESKSEIGVEESETSVEVIEEAEKVCSAACTFHCPRIERKESSIASEKYDTTFSSLESVANVSEENVAAEIEEIVAEKEPINEKVKTIKSLNKMQIVVSLADMDVDSNKSKSSTTCSSQAHSVEHMSDSMEEINLPISEQDESSIRSSAAISNPSTTTAKVNSSKSFIKRMSDSLKRNSLRK